MTRREQVVSEFISGWRTTTTAGILVALFSSLLFLMFAIWGTRLIKVDGAYLTPTEISRQHPIQQSNLSLSRSDILAADRQQIVNRVREFFERYGSPMSPYVEILIDQSYACGGNYRVLVGIAGSESGLGKKPYKLYNPFGYLNNVQYNSWEEALTELSCKISQQHISKCGEDLYCLGLRYAGPSDDLNLFISKVAWFMGQV